MNILVFSPYFSPYMSGMTVYMQRLLSYFAKKNAITVLTFPHSSSLKEIEHTVCGRILRMPYWFKLSKGYISPQSLIIFLRELISTHLVIINLPNAEALPLICIARLLNKKVICIFHCQVFLGKEFNAKIISLFLNTSVFFQLLLSNRIVAYTEDYISSLWITRFFKKKIKTVLPPIEKLPVHRQVLSHFLSLKKGEAIWIGFSGRISREKGIEYVIEAIRNLRKKQKLPLHFVIAGPYGKTVSGEQSYFLKIKKLLRKETIPFKMFGELSMDELGAFYRSIDILVLPSINYTEAFGMVQAEAMLLGTPVIATNLPGVRIPVKLTKMGLLVEPNDSRQIAQAILKIVKNNTIYKNINAQKKAKNLFSIQNTLTFYSNML